jgi:hypothetical protein
MELTLTKYGRTNLNELLKVIEWCTSNVANSSSCPVYIRVDLLIYSMNGRYPLPLQKRIH